jgi:hypothetical protein
LHSVIGSFDKKKYTVDSDRDANHEAEEVDRQPGAYREISYAASSSEILRRLHQVLSLYENVQILSSAEKIFGSNGSGKGDDLQPLNKPVEIQFSPSTFNESKGVEPKTRSIVHAEPLIQFPDLNLHVLGTYRPNDPFYSSYCNRYGHSGSVVLFQSLVA